jgi:hypothetical protein
MDYAAPQAYSNPFRGEQDLELHMADIRQKLDSTHFRLRIFGQNKMFKNRVFIFFAIFGSKNLHVLRKSS